MTNMLNTNIKVIKTDRGTIDALRLLGNYLVSLSRPVKSTQLQIDELSKDGKQTTIIKFWYEEAT